MEPTAKKSSADQSPTERARAVAASLGEIKSLATGDDGKLTATVHSGYLAGLNFTLEFTEEGRLVELYESQGAQIKRYEKDSALFLLLQAIEDSEEVADSSWKGRAMRAAKEAKIRATIIGDRISEAASSSLVAAELKTTVNSSIEEFRPVLKAGREAVASRLDLLLARIEGATEAKAEEQEEGAPEQDSSASLPSIRVLHGGTVSIFEPEGPGGTFELSKPEDFLEFSVYDGQSNPIDGTLLRVTDELFRLDSTAGDFEFNLGEEEFVEITLDSDTLSYHFGKSNYTGKD